MRPPSMLPPSPRDTVPWPWSLPLLPFFPERAAELGDHHHGVLPLVSQRVRVGGKAAAEVVESVRQSALRAAFVDMRIPAADIDETEPDLVAH